MNNNNNSNSILTEYSVYQVDPDKPYYTMKELNDMGFECFDVSPFSIEKFGSIKTVECHNSLFIDLTVNTLEKLLVRSSKLEVAEGFPGQKIFVKIEGEKATAIELFEFYILDFMGTPFFFMSIEEREEARIRLLEFFNKCGKTVCKPIIDIYPKSRKAYQKQLSIRKNLEQLKENIPND